MIVFKKNPNSTSGRSYSHIECDVCSEAAPPAGDLLKKNLFERGWFIAGGKHRCPAHFEWDTDNALGPIERAQDGSEGFVR